MPRARPVRLALAPGTGTSTLISSRQWLGPSPPCLQIALVRMQADGVLPPAERRNYRGIFDAVRRIVKEEGVANLWRGSTPTVLRAMSLNMGMLATADQAKEVSERSGVGWGARWLCVAAAPSSGVPMPLAPASAISTKCVCARLRLHPLAVPRPIPWRREVRPHPRRLVGHLRRHRIGHVAAL